MLKKTGKGPDSGSPRIVSAYGPGSHIHHNTITHTTVTTENSGPEAIEIVLSPGCIVEDNEIIKTTAESLTIGMILWWSPNCAVRNNTFENPRHSPLDVGIWLVESEGVDISSNDFINVTTELMIQ